MLSALRSSAFRSSSVRSFSTTTARRWDVAKLTLVGTLIRDPEIRTTKSEKEYAMYTVATTNYPPITDANGDRSSTFHRVLSFNEHSLKYLKTLRKGTKVYVEANYEVKEPEPGADPSTARGQRQIFLKQEAIRVISPPRIREDTTEEEGSERF